MPIRDLLEFAAPAGGPNPDARLEALLAAREGDADASPQAVQSTSAG